MRMWGHMRMWGQILQSYIVIMQDPTLMLRVRWRAAGRLSCTLG